MDAVVFHSRVGSDGALSSRVPLGADKAGTDVVVTNQPAPRTGCNGRTSEWSRFIDQTYGSFADLGLEEPPDLPLVRVRVAS